MPLFVVEHPTLRRPLPRRQPADRPFLLQILSNDPAGPSIRGDGVARGRRHRYVIIEGPSEGAVRSYLAPFGQAGSLDVLAASSCEEVVARGACGGPAGSRAPTAARRSVGLQGPSGSRGYPFNTPRRLYFKGVDFSPGFRE
jgi:hypothetical protein